MGMLEGKAVVITGSGRGIGAACAIGAAMQGAWVVETYGMTIEDVAASVAPSGALVDGLVHKPLHTGIGPPIPVGPRVVLTPRSAEACMIEGVDPRDLYLRPLDTFTWGKHADQAVARMRQDVYNRMREEKLDAVRRARRGQLWAAAKDGALGRCQNVKVRQRRGAANAPRRTRDERGAPGHCLGHGKSFRPRPRGTRAAWCRPTDRSARWDSRR